MRICDLREKEVVNVCTCHCIGFVMDVDIDECTGCVRALIVPGPAKFWGIFGREFEYVIPWKDIVKIGPDIILVEIKEEKC
ncbi:MAG: YlmC/YmxH family sporulation protein [Lachnospiraceae bacterium]|nr:YlmC/YmxH family sporulation protein [Lachnospiraceae bacterium]MCI9149813.1 YlmC/YmxH family sporulation protein [Lachnospiraceae bacterium]